MSKLERIITFPRAAFHKVDEGYGVGSVACLFVLSGKLGALTFDFFTGMYLPKTYEYWEGRGVGYGNKPSYGASYLQYHLPERSEEYDTKTDDCKWLGNKPCYSGGSCTMGSDLMKLLVSEGEEAVWESMEKTYNEWITNPKGGDDGKQG